MRRPALVVALVAAAALSACQDPAGVGLGLIDEEGADPNVRSIEAASVDTVAFLRTAIGFANPNETLAQPRVLVGEVADPVFGDARAVAYVDAVQPSIGDREAADIEAVWLELRRDYVYGDTTVALPVSLRPIVGTWSASASYPADTTFTTGNPVATTTVTVADTLVRFDLSAAWVSANAAVLFGTGFDAAFEGFALEAAAPPAGAGVVYGFSTLATAGSRLRVATDEDTLSFSLQEVFTSLQTAAPVAPSATAFPARAYSNGGVEVTFDFAGVTSLPLARALLLAPLDRTLAEEGSFVRPLAARTGLYGIPTSGDPVYLADVVAGTEGDASTVVTSRLTPLLQAVLLGNLAFERYELRPGSSDGSVLPASLDILPVFRPGMGEPVRLSLTVVGQQAI